MTTEVEAFQSGDKKSHLSDDVAERESSRRIKYLMGACVAMTAIMASCSTIETYMVGQSRSSSFDFESTDREQR